MSEGVKAGRERTSHDGPSVKCYELIGGSRDCSLKSLGLTRQLGVYQTQDANSTADLFEI